MLVYKGFGAGKKGLCLSQPCLADCPANNNTLNQTGIRSAGSVELGDQLTNFRLLQAIFYCIAIIVKAQFKTLPFSHRQCSEASEANQGSLTRGATARNRSKCLP